MNSIFINTWYNRMNKALDRSEAAIGNEESYDLHTMSVFFYADIALRKTKLDRDEWMEKIEERMFSEDIPSVRQFVDDLKMKLAE